MLDTSIAVFALLWRGTPYRLLTEIRQQSGDADLLTLKQHQGIAILTAVQGLKTFRQKIGV